MPAKNLRYFIIESIKLLASPGEDFSDDAILNSPKWELIREKAKALLEYLGEEYSVPDKSAV